MLSMIVHMLHILNNVRSFISIPKDMMGEPKPNDGDGNHH